MIISPPAAPTRRGGGAGPAEVIISLLLVTRVDFGSVKHCTAVSDNTDGRALLYRSKIDHDGAEISHLCHFQCCHTAPPSYLRSSARSVPFDEIVANLSDLKHVVELLGRSDGLGMVILTR